MDKSNIRVLELSYSIELFNNPSESPGDTHMRVLAYSKEIEQLVMIIHTYNKRTFNSHWLSNNLCIIPTNGYNKAHSLLRMFQIANKICKEKNINIIHSQEPIFTGFIAYILKKKYGLPINICLFGGNLYDPYWLKTKPLHAVFSGIGRYILKKADSIQVEASLIKESLINNGIDPRKIHQRPMVPYNLEDFSKANGEGLRKKLLNNKYDHIILFVGRMVKEKNLINFLKGIKLVLERNPSVLLLMIGEGIGKGKEKEKAILFAEEIKISGNIKWLGHIPQNMLPEYYKAADLFALFSVSEGFPRVLMEAVAAGLPIVSSRVSGSTDTIINGESGFIVEINDIKDFADKICLLLENKDLRENFSKKAYECLKNLGTFQEITVKKQIEIWQAMI